MIADDASEITDFIGGILLRYFRQGVLSSADTNRIDANRDRELLRLHWAVSWTVRELTDHIQRHRHETQSFLTFRARSDDGPIRGRLDARATLIRRLISGNPATSVSFEPVRSFSSGPNHVLVWVLQQAWQLARRFLRWLPPDASYRPMVERSAIELDQTRNIQSVRQAMEEINLSRRPNSGALQSAAKSRRAVYRLAYEAYMMLTALEAGDESAIQRVLRETLLAPIDVWRRFELAVGLGAAESLSEANGAPLQLNVLAGSSRTPIARAGNFSIYWQTTTSAYSAPPQEPSEAVTESVLLGFGMQGDRDRPDFVVLDEARGEAVAIIEVKFFSSGGEDAWDKLRDAVHQIVRYGRGYVPLDQIDPLIGRSLIALMRKPSLETSEKPNLPFVIDFSDIKAGTTKDWARTVSPAEQAGPE